MTWWWGRANNLITCWKWRVVKSAWISDCNYIILIHGSISSSTNVFINRKLKRVKGNEERWRVAKQSECTLSEEIAHSTVYHHQSQQQESFTPRNPELSDWRRSIFMSTHVISQNMPPISREATKRLWTKCTRFLPITGVRCFFWECSYTKIDLWFNQLNITKLETNLS